MRLLSCACELLLSAHMMFPLALISGAKISAHVLAGGVTAARAVPVPAMVRPTASAAAASAPASFLKRWRMRLSPLSLRGMPGPCAGHRHQARDPGWPGAETG